MLVENTFTLPERLSENLKCVLFIDEFPSIITLKDNNSSYIQFLGKMLEKQETVSAKDIKDVEDEFLQEEGNIIFKEEFEKLSSKQRIIVLALAKGARTPKAIAKEAGEKVSNINRFLSYLNEKGYISREKKGVYRIDDPVFSLWVKGISQ